MVNTTIPVIEIGLNSKDQVKSIRAIIPTWTKINSADKIDVIIPLLGIETTAKSIEDVKGAVGEAIQCFVHFAEAEGSLGLVDELKYQNWKQVEKSIFELDTENNTITSLLKTGETMSLDLAI